MSAITSITVTATAAPIPAKKREPMTRDRAIERLRVSLAQMRLGFYSAASKTIGEVLSPEVFSPHNLHVLSRVEVNLKVLDRNFCDDHCSRLTQAISQAVAILENERNHLDL